MLVAQKDKTGREIWLFVIRFHDVLTKRKRLKDEVTQGCIQHLCTEMGKGLLFVVKIHANKRVVSGKNWAFVLFFVFVFVFFLHSQNFAGTKFCLIFRLSSLSG